MLPLCRFRSPAYLGYQEAPERRVPCDAVGQVHGDDVCKALHFVDHRVCVRHGCAVLQVRHPRAPHHAINLFLNAGWRWEEKVVDNGVLRNSWDWNRFVGVHGTGSSQSFSSCRRWLVIIARGKLRQEDSCEFWLVWVSKHLFWRGDNVDCCKGFWVWVCVGGL